MTFGTGGEGPRARVMLWNRTSYLIPQPAYASLVIDNDLDLPEILQVEIPDVLLVDGPSPSQDLVREFRATVPGFAGITLSMVDPFHSGEEIQVLAGDLDRAQQFITGVERLSSMPTVAQRILQAVEDPASTPNTLAQLIAPDPGLTAMVLRHANSPVFGIRRQIGNIPDAVIVLGFRQVGELALAASLVDLFGQRDARAERLWRLRLLVASASARLSRKLSQSESAAKDIFVAGMLHDIGRSVLFQHHRAVYDEAYDNIEGHDAYTVCMARLGFHPGDIGCALAKQWNLGEAVEICTRFHHAPEAISHRMVPSAHIETLGAVMAAKEIAAAITYPEQREFAQSNILMLASLQGLKNASAIAEAAEAVRQEIGQAIQKRAA